MSAQHRIKQQLVVVSIAHASGMLDVSRRTIYAMMANGDLEWTVIGHRRRIKVASIRRLIARGSAKSKMKASDEAATAV